MTRIPWVIVVCTLALILIGLSGIARGDELAGSGNYFARQLVWIGLAIPVMFLVTVVSYRSLRWVSYPLFALNLLLLGIVYFMPAINGAHRWIPLGFINFQPSEVAKLTFMMALAQYLMHRKNYRSLQGLLIPFAIALLPVGLILREPDLGTSLVFLPVLFAMLFAAGARPRHLVLVCCLGIALLPALWLGMSAEQKSRVVTLFVQKDSGPAPHGDGYHLHQSKQLLSLGGKVGSEISGTATADSRAYHLPAGRTDFIFCLVGERWGLLGCLVTLGIYLLLFARGLLIAVATREPFGRLLAVGIVALLATQLLINTGMTVGLMPITGLTLPLMSYGGSSLLATSVALGLLMNISMRPGYEVTSEPFRFGDK
ncbi:Rod shape-determining protein RodA [hydrothermal vent metagenome]|uniref:Rod shape-determining protein RodA n=1 Tax=hydrothermal vent metagenome TaxID=652676 RepID=A0A3B1DY48_9ZZZZ